MDSSPNLTLPYIIAAQAQKHVTHNEAIRALDALVQLMVLDKDLASPPGSPVDGNRYIVAASPTGAWAGQAGKVAAYQDGTWEFFAPRKGWLAWVADEDRIYAHNGTAWAELTVSAGSGATIWGINATADTTNRLAVKSTASLLDNVGNGHQQKINKAAAGDTASQLFQTGYSGRAEFGLCGDDDFHVKVSPDGSSWKEALIVDRSTGVVRFPLTSRIVAPQGRPTLVTGTPVMTSDQAAKTTIYYTPFVGSLAPFWDGTTWTLVSLAELLLALDSNSGHTGYHQSGKNFDLFLDYNSGTPRLVSRPAWTNDTTRATDIVRQNGIWLNSASMTVRFGTNSGDTATLAASRATYVGTFRASADGQTESKLGSSAAGGGKASLLLWSAYNRVPVQCVVLDSTGSWADTGDGNYHAFNGSNNNRVQVVRGLAEDPAQMWFGTLFSQTGGATGLAAIGIDSVTGHSGQNALGNLTTAQNLWARHSAILALGFHFIQATVFSSGATVTWYGNNNSGLFVDTFY